MIKLTNVKKYFSAGAVKAVDSVSLEIRKGSSFGLVGESGSGKTTLGAIALCLIKPDSGSVEVTAKNAQVIFQDPYHSLDPRMKVADIIAEGLKIMVRRQASGVRVKKEIKRSVENIIELVHLPQETMGKYPHQFSGGERQRIAIARALITEPDFIVCDEPVSSLDVLIQLDILKLLKEIHKRLSITYLFISHDLRVVRFMCDTIAVMKEGKIIETGPTEKIYSSPASEYTKTLLSSIPYL